jgi:hypothetical protein
MDRLGTLPRGRFETAAVRLRLERREGAVRAAFFRAQSQYWAVQLLQRLEERF